MLYLCGECGALGRDDWREVEHATGCAVAADAAPLVARVNRDKATVRHVAEAEAALGPLSAGLATEVARERDPAPRCARCEGSGRVVYAGNLRTCPGCAGRGTL